MLLSSHFDLYFGIFMSCFIFCVFTVLFASSRNTAKGTWVYTTHTKYEGGKNQALYNCKLVLINRGI